MAADRNGLRLPIVCHRSSPSRSFVLASPHRNRRFRWGPRLRALQHPTETRGFGGDPASDLDRSHAGDRLSRYERLATSTFSVANPSLPAVAAR